MLNLEDWKLAAAEARSTSSGSTKALILKSCVISHHPRSPPCPSVCLIHIMEYCRTESDELACYSGQLYPTFTTDGDPHSSRHCTLGGDSNEAGCGDDLAPHGVTATQAHAWNGWRVGGRGLDQAAASNSYCSCFKLTMYPEYMNPRVLRHPSTCLVH